MYTLTHTPMRLDPMLLDPMRALSCTPQISMSASDVPEAPDAPDAVVTSGERPEDAEILQQQNAIRAEMSSIPYVGDLESLSTLRAEYAQGSQVFLSKIDRLGALGYSYMRRTRGDGNCCYRGFIFGYLERLLLNNNTSECQR
jgi:ubiquitin thioesterase protein OTUB1